MPNGDSLKVPMLSGHHFFTDTESPGEQQADFIKVELPPTRQNRSEQFWLLLKNMVGLLPAWNYLLQHNVTLGLTVDALCMYVYMCVCVCISFRYHNMYVFIYTYRDGTALCSMFNRELHRWDVHDSLSHNSLARFSLIFFCAGNWFLLFVAVGCEPKWALTHSEPLLGAIQIGWSIEIF